MTKKKSAAKATTPTAPAPAPSPALISEETAEAFTLRTYRDYGIHTIEERAIPALQDGLLPVQRRVLFSMWEMGARQGSNFVKCAGIVGDVMRKYHPHGDASIYGTLVNMVNPGLSCFGGDPRAPIEPQGNFGMPRPGEGDPPKYPAGAMRYTEARLSKVGGALFECLDVAIMEPNFDGRFNEPKIIPSRLPFLLLSGAYGVALGANTCIPPHHPHEVLRAARYMLRKPGASVSKLLKYVHGPDYGHSSLLSTQEEVAEVYRVGKGTLYYVCDHHIERGKDSHELIITSWAPGFLSKQFMKLLSQLQDENKIIAYNDETGDSGPRLSIQFRDPTVIEERVLPKLRSYIPYNWNVIDKSGPEPRFMQINLVSYITMWLEYRKKVERSMLILEKKRRREELSREQAKMAGIQNIDVLAKILANREMNPEQKVKEIQQKVVFRWGTREAHLSEEQVHYLYDQKIRVLDALNLGEQKSRIVAILKEIKRIRHDLGHLSEFLDARLRDAVALFPKEYTRRTRLLNGQEPKLELPEGGTSVGFWCIDKNGFVRSFSNLPQRKGKWFADSWTLPATPNIVVVGSDGTANTFQSVFLSHGRCGVSSIAGMASDAVAYLVVMDANGDIGIVDNPPAKSKITVMNINDGTGSNRSANRLVFAGGANGDDLLYITDGRKYVVKKISEIGSKRPNSQGVTLLKSIRPLRIHIIPKQGELIASGEGVVDFDRAARADSVMAVGPTNNWVVDANNEKAVMTAAKAISTARDTGISHISVIR
jgi:DNA gyrase/topoisomerase IV subunit A